MADNFCHFGRVGRAYEHIRLGDVELPQCIVAFERLSLLAGVEDHYTLGPCGWVEFEPQLAGRFQLRVHRKLDAYFGCEAVHHLALLVESRVAR